MEKEIRNRLRWRGDWRNGNVSRKDNAIRNKIMGNNEVSKVEIVETDL